MGLINLADFIREAKPDEILKMEQLARDVVKPMFDKIDSDGLVVEILEQDKEQFINLISLYVSYGLCKRCTTYARNKEGFDKERLALFEEQYNIGHRLLERSGMKPEEI